MAGKLNVCVVTGTRAEFGIWRPVLDAIQASKLLNLQLVVTGMHLLKDFGMTVREIESEKYPIAEQVKMYDEAGMANPDDASASLARGIDGLATAYRKHAANLVMVLGDRLEVLAASSAALACRIPIAHVHGGETAPGIWDEQIRHALTKMAHVHFCATESAGQRIRQMGEPAARVHVVGAPALDRIEAYWQFQYPIIAKVRGYRRIGARGPSAVMLVHPGGGSDDEEYQRMRTLLALSKRLVGEVEVIGPNNDPGCAGILRAITESKAHFNMSVHQEHFWHSVVFSSMLIGNSSSGIIEAASLGVPVVNIGTRQAGRERNLNVIDVDWTPADIARGIERALHDQEFRRRVSRRKNIYGDAHASERIVAVLEEIAKTGLPMEKRFVDLPSRDR